MNKRIGMGVAIALVAILVFGTLLARQLTLFPTDYLIVEANQNYSITEDTNRSLAVFAPTVDLNANVDGHALVGTESLTLTGTIQDDLTAFAEHIAFSGHVAGNVIFLADTVQLGGQIEGDVVVLATDLTVSEDFSGSVITACVENTPVNNSDVQFAECDKQAAETIFARAGTQVASVGFVTLLNNTNAYQIFSALLPMPVILFLTGLAALTVTVFPRTIRNIETTVRVNPVQMLSTGVMVTLMMVGITAAWLVLAVYLTPIALILCPFFLFAAFIFAVLLIVGWMTLTLTFGGWLARRLAQSIIPPIVATVMGGLVLAALSYGLSWLPLGDMLASVTFFGLGLAGLGAAYATRMGRRSIITI